MQQLSFTCQLWEAITDPVGETSLFLSLGLPDFSGGVASLPDSRQGFVPSPSSTYLQGCQGSLPVAFLCLA